jgi:proteic killer suppression protein
MRKIYRVEYSKFAAKQIERLPSVIKENVFLWKDVVERIGLLEARKNKSYHDEPLQGQRLGQRSIRLNKSYRLFYNLSEHSMVVVVGVIEVNKHGY